MLALPKKLFHAIEAMLVLSYRVTGEPMSGKELCEKLNLPPRYLEAMMQQLVRVGILRGVRGPSGGYQLAKSPERISLTDICLALREEDELPESHTQLGQKVLLTVCERMQENSLRFLDDVTLASLAAEATSLHIKREGAQLMDFTI